jgi:asparagine synthase (glutamine-hydrolysing)
VTATQGLFGGALNVTGWERRFLEAWASAHASKLDFGQATKSAAFPLAAFATEKVHIARDDARGLVCALHGDIFNRADVARTCQGLSESLLPPNPAEVVLAAYNAKNLHVALRLARGSFVFSISDKDRGKVTAGRDSYGGRTLYYAETPHGFVYSSRLAPLARLPCISREIDPVGLMEYFAGGYITAPHTILAEVKLLPPGHLAEFGDTVVKISSFAPLEPRRWSVHDLHTQGEKALLDHFERLLVEAVQCRLPGSGETAVYLSGGTDTSLLTSILRRHTDREVAAFTLGLQQSPNDESDYARAVAGHLGVKDHRIYRLDRDDFLEAFDNLPEIFGQPFADISAIPTSVITRELADEFGSVYCGDGPDFLFGNFDFKLLFNYYRLFPPALRQGLSRLAEQTIKTFFGKWVSPNLSVPEMMRQPEFFWIFQKKFKSAALSRLLNRSIRCEDFPVHAFLGSRTDIPASERLLLAEHMFYGMDDVLCKATSCHDFWGVSLLRPFYDQPLFEFCRGLPTRYKFRRGRGRYLQKLLLARFLPPRMIHRPKRGFIIDFVEFGADNLRHLTDRYLTRQRLEERGLINADFALECVDEYYRGNRNLGPKVWTLLIFEAWREAFGA